MTFYDWLKQSPLSERGCQQHVTYIEKFKSWCAKKLIDDPDRLHHAELLDYVKHLKRQKLKPHTINIRINSISKYYDYLGKLGEREDNPAKNLRIKGQVKTVRKDVLTPEQIQEFYHQYVEQKNFKSPFGNILHQRNIVMLGLIINQGAHSGEIARMEVGDIKLNEGKVYVPSSEGSNSRELELHASQIMPINNYLNHIRPLLNPKEEELIPGRPQSILAHVFKQIRQQYKGINSAQQLRASVIMQWVKQYPIREVQYRCGHKKIGSTEAYQQQDLETLQNQLQKHHPLS